MQPGNDQLAAQPLLIVARQQRLDQPERARADRLKQPRKERHLHALGELVDGNVRPIELAQHGIDIDERPCGRAHEDGDTGDTQKCPESDGQQVHQTSILASFLIIAMPKSTEMPAMNRATSPPPWNMGFS